ncbi:MAG: sn-glycerol-3-phosphate ABC transporter ATP-binding protein UgpC [Alphaproteobacteria bacterium]|nr:sn-glycerol-3-phosphate ABC transporter ATP-binding protein UgpC [Alphaproteobacteria bacterium]MCB9695318.1 sn-glycerol-3-phosphate ABC transporter ATP-binding protein UgpC [Alphaproteobacteria bacterium]
MTAGLAFHAIEKRYGETRVLERIDAAFEEGEYVVLVGPSGCGKSTLLRCIAGLEEITSGDLLIGDRRVNDLAPKDRDVAMVFQSYALYPHMTVRQNMAFPLEIRKRPRAEIDRAVEEAAKMLELSHLLERKPAQLSGGQRQRVAMGRAVVRRPRVFLFDEPLSNLDASLRHHMRVELKRLHRALGSTIVHVTHDQVEAMTLADRILVLNHGVVQQVGTPRELFDRPANQFVATFIGSPSMNMVAVEGRGDHVVTAGGARLDVSGTGAFTLGFRPTDVELVAGDAATVDVVESLGPEALVHLDLAGAPVIAQLREPVAQKVGERVGLRPTVVHRFGADGQRVG